MSAGLVMLAAIVVVVLVAPASPPSDGDVSGDAAVRWPPPTRAVERARADYLAALFRARARGSVEGVLGACEGFADLGDRDVVTACLRIARGLAGAERVDDRLRALEQRHR
jgi:hypothetical protein